jgi:hypothetical protein
MRYLMSGKSNSTNETILSLLILHPNKLSIRSCYYVPIFNIRKYFDVIIICIKIIIFLLIFIIIFYHHFLFFSLIGSILVVLVLG